MSNLSKKLPLWYSTNIFKKVITNNEVVPFYELTLPDQNILEIESVILLEGTNYSTDPTPQEFFSSENRFYEVDYLAQQRVFIENTNSGSNSATTGSTGIKAGIWIDVTRKFIKEFTANGFCEHGLLKYCDSSPNFYVGGRKSCKLLCHIKSQWVQVNLQRKCPDSSLECCYFDGQTSQGTKRRS
mgnify:CR=1 FL=1